MPVTLDEPLRLPCGVQLPNRLLKSAMSEGLATFDNRVTPELITLYGRWAEGGVGLCVTGNVMIDRRALGEPGNVALEDDRDLDTFQAWALAGTGHDTACWMQLNHPGKQVPRGLNSESVSPSAVPFRADMARFFATPRALKEAEIEELIARFGVSARLAKRAGFSGVQIHGAHGYLVSQFLSPHHNQRDDAWGGSPENRRRFVLAVYDSIRAAVGTSFPVSIKLNSADFQQGGLSEDESLDVVKCLAERGIDLVEISGGTYEAPVMAKGAPIRESTRKREAYFLDFAAKARGRVAVPLAVTGGFRTFEGISNALGSGALDVVGLARALALDPDFPKKLLASPETVSSVRPIRTGVGLIDRTGMMEVSFYSRQLRRMGRGKEPKPHENPKLALASILATQGIGALFTRLRARPAPAPEPEQPEAARV
ncbi:MAG: NADH:flavin oxidoreductase/NADH oxidase family protein [Myxococcales bacterium]